MLSSRSYNVDQAPVSTLGSRGGPLLASSRPATGGKGPQKRVSPGLGLVLIFPHRLDLCSACICIFVSPPLMANEPGSDPSRVQDQSPLAVGLRRLITHKLVVQPQPTPQPPPKGGDAAPRKRPAAGGKGAGAKGAPAGGKCLGGCPSYLGEPIEIRERERSEAWQS
jgi:hypothetical protein